jgi:hypothetical protein
MASFLLRKSGQETVHLEGPGKSRSKLKKWACRPGTSLLQMPQKDIEYVDEAIELSAEDWEKILERLEEPPKNIPKLAKFLQDTPSPWEKNEDKPINSEILISEEFYENLGQLIFWSIVFGILILGLALFAK